MHSVEMAYGPWPIDGEDEPKLSERWFGFIAKAAVGQLARPNAVPVRTVA